MSDIYAPYASAEEQRAIRAEYEQHQRMVDEWMAFSTKSELRRRKLHRSFWMVTAILVFCWVSIVGLWAGAGR